MKLYHKILIIICRMLLGVTFTFSGIVKAVDPTGTAIKFTEYFHSLHLDFLVPLAMSAAVLLAAFEFLIGVALIMGTSWRKTTFWCLATMCVMTPLTLYLAIANPVDDCGCFGDAVKLTNWETFWKNIVLLSAAIYLMVKRHPIFSFYSRDFQWFPSVLTFLFSIFISWLSLNHLPLLDFRPYKVGNYLPDLMTIPEGKTQDEYESTFIYSKNGVEKEFTIENYPAEDSTWSFVDTKTKLVKKGYTPPIADFVIFDDDGVDIAPSILADSSYTFLMIFSNIEKADDTSIDKINDLYDYTLDEGIPFYALTASGSEAINEWRDNTGAEYPLYRSDETVLKTMTRANPGVMLLRKGVVLAKWNANDLPNEDVMLKYLENPTSLSERQQLLGYIFWFLCLIFIAILTLLLILERSTNAIINRIRILRGVKEFVDKIDPEEVIETTILHSKQTKTIMRRKIVAGNWKMNKNLQEGVALATELKAALNGKTVNCDIIIGAPFTHIASVATAVEGSVVNVAAQNCADKTSGAYTGEVSASMVASTGAKYVILGHSERRAYYGETNEILKEKTLLAMANGLTPIFCIGEVLEEREAEKHFEVVKSQIEEALFNLSAEEFGKIVLAYEPVWAIGTGKTASPAQAQEIHAFIRQTVANKYGKEVADATQILYGGSCNAANAKELFANPDVDGGLIGGASLTVEAFLPIIEAC